MIILNAKTKMALIVRGLSLKSCLRVSLEFSGNGLEKFDMDQIWSAESEDTLNKANVND